MRTTAATAQTGGVLFAGWRWAVSPFSSSKIRGGREAKTAGENFITRRHSLFANFDFFPATMIRGSAI